MLAGKKGKSWAAECHRRDFRSRGTDVDRLLLLRSVGKWLWQKEQEVRKVFRFLL